MSSPFLIGTDPYGLSAAETFGRGTTIYFQGDVVGHWFEIESGVVRTCRFLADGTRQVTGFYYPGDVLGVDDKAYRESAEAVTKAVVARHGLPANDDRGTRFNHRERLLEKALLSARERIFLLSHRSAASRLAAFLISTAGRCRSPSRIFLPMSRADIADYLNLTLHTVSRTICEIARDDLITFDGRHEVRILDWERLLILAGEATGDPRSNGQDVVATKRSNWYQEFA